METANEISPEGRLWLAIREELTHEQRIEKAREFHDRGEDLKTVLAIFPEYQEVVKERKVG